MNALTNPCDQCHTLVLLLDSLLYALHYASKVRKIDIALVSSELVPYFHLP